MHRRFRLLSLLCILAAFAVALTACGGEDDQDVGAILEQTFGENDEQVDSGRLRLGVRVNAQGLEGLQGPLSLQLEGPFASADEDGELPRFSFDLSLNAGAPQAFQAGATSTGDKGFVSFQGQAYALSEQLFEQFKRGYQQAQRENPREENDTTFAQLGIDPRRWLQDPQIVGEEEVGGAETIHIRAGIAVDRFLADIDRILGQAERLGVTEEGQVPESLTEEQRRQITEAVQSARMDVWTGKDDKLIRKLRVEVAFDVPEDAREDVGGLEAGEVALELLLAELNEDQEIEAPENAQPFDQLLGQLGLAGAVPGAGGGGGGGGGEQPAPQAPAASQEYLDCLQAAGEDVTEAQKCASLLGQPE